MAKPARFRFGLAVALGLPWLLCLPDLLSGAGGQRGLDLAGRNRLPPALRQEGVIAGRVWSQPGQPAPGRPVLLGLTAHPETPVWRCRSDGEGKFRFPRVHPGRWWLAVEVETAQYGRQWVDRHTIPLPRAMGWVQDLTAVAERPIWLQGFLPPLEGWDPPQWSLLDRAFQPAGWLQRRQSGRVLFRSQSSGPLMGFAFQQRRTGLLVEQRFAASSWFHPAENPDQAAEVHCGESLVRFELDPELRFSEGVQLRLRILPPLDLEHPLAALLHARKRAGGPVPWQPGSRYQIQGLPPGNYEVQLQRGDRIESRSFGLDLGETLEVSLKSEWKALLNSTAAPKKSP
ncbi:MAG: carboxypeptidase regulatory-like domain-containing protein [Planctomycetota bacterium]|nr:MAG: carboxypeptidase regulatory-like domain-containing protein [Planctomycetota bacterium]